MNGELTERKREIVSLALTLFPKRTAAQVLNISYVKLDRHVADIRQRLGLPDRWAEFGGLAIGGAFRHGGVRYTKVPHATDQRGGYNAQSEDGERHLFRRDQVVEKL